MESTGKKRCGFTVQVFEADQILASKNVARETQVQGLGFVVVAGFESGEWEWEEIDNVGSAHGVAL